MKLTFEVDTEDARTTTRFLYAIADLMETIDAEIVGMIRGGRADD